MSIYAETNQLFDMAHRLHGELGTLRESIIASGEEFFTSNVDYQQLSAMASAVSLAANLGALISFDRTLTKS